LIKQLLLGATGMILVAVGYYILIPTWNFIANGLMNGAQTVVTNPAYMANIQAYAYYLNIIIGVMFIGTGIGIWIWVALFAWKKETVTYGFSDEEFA
jgi:hypothetical protein